VIGKSPANRPYMYLPLKGDTNDYSTNAQNPSNTGVTTTTGQFGESNGAYEWNSNTDTIYQNSTIADTVRGYFNDSFTLYVWIYPTNFNTTRRIITSGQFDYGFGIQTTGGISAALQIFTYQAGSTFVSKNSSNSVYSVNAWQSYIIKSSDNSINLDIIGYNTDTEIFNDTITKATYDSNNNFAIGNDGNGNSSLSYRGKMHTFRIYDVTLSDGALKILNNEKGRISLPKKLLLDNYSGSAAAYSLRKLRYNYSGSAIRVRRASDNAEQDIGFVSNELDTTSLASFCSGTNGFVTIWYDQSGNGKNATQTTTANQPKIYDSSTGVLTENSKPCLQFDGVNDVLTSGGFGTGPERSVFSLFKGTGDGSGYENYYMFLEALPSTSGDFMQLYSPDYTASLIFNFLTASLDVTSSTAIDTQQIVTSLKTSTTSNLYQNGSNTGSGSGSQSLEGVLTLGGYTANFANAKFQELIVYNTDQTSNRDAIETNINSYYGVY